MPFLLLAQVPLPGLAEDRNQAASCPRSLSSSSTSSEVVRLSMAQGWAEMLVKCWVDLFDQFLLKRNFEKGKLLNRNLREKVVVSLRDKYWSM